MTKEQYPLRYNNSVVWACFDSHISTTTIHSVQLQLKIIIYYERACACESMNARARVYLIITDKRARLALFERRYILQL